SAQPSACGSSDWLQPKRSDMILAPPLWSTYSTSGAIMRSRGLSTVGNLDSSTGASGRVRSTSFNMELQLIDCKHIRIPWLATPGAHSCVGRFELYADYRFHSRAGKGADPGAPGAARGCQ